jgi:hypothetical protein
MAKLLAPGANFSKLPLDIHLLNPSLLYRVSTHVSGEPYFGRSGGNRFDDPAAKQVNRYGTCYLGLNLTVAIAESLLHDTVPESGTFEVPASEIEARYVFRFSGMGLRLANLTGTALMLLNGNGEISGTTNYTLTQKWSRAVYDHPQQVDGLLYMSRRVNDSIAVVLFERDPKKAAALKASTPVRLSEHPEFAASAKQLRLSGI